MYCYQCEQTAKGVACTKAGVCGKKPETAALQDLLIHMAKSVSMYAHRARALDVIDREADVFVIEALFTTVTNVNFDPERLAGLIRKGVGVRDNVRGLYEDAVRKDGGTPDELPDAATFQPEGDLDALTAQGEQVSIERRQTDLGSDIVGLQELMLYGLKGAAAYVDHAIVLGVEDDELYATFHKAMNYLARKDASAEELLEWCLWTGEINMRAMEVLDSRSDRWWLMVESGDVDWASHSNNIDNAIGAVHSGDDAFEGVVKWIEENGGWEDTALFLTSDHGHYFQLTQPEALAKTAPTP